MPGTANSVSPVAGAPAAAADASAAAAFVFARALGGESGGGAGTATTAPPFATPSRPKRLGRFDIVAEIAGGGCSTISRARAADRVAAVKVVRHELASDSETVDMFLDEARVLSRLDHPNLVRTLEFGSDQEQYFI